MDTRTIEHRRNEIIAQSGEWTGHNIELAPGIFTRDADSVAEGPDLIPMLDDFARKPASEMRIVDVGCLEGLHSIEFARLGATAVGIEVRLQNLEKARFAAEALGLDRVEFVQDDALHLSVERYGHFDLVFCQGLLYHLNAPDVFEFMRRMAEVCTGFLYLNTHIAPADLGDNPHGLGDLETFEFEGRQYQGRRYQEHTPDSSPEQRMASLWASLDNTCSVWLTMDALAVALVHCGFARVYHCLTYWNTADRVTLIATVS